jgi:amyloid beta A4 precursor protein-binding family B protein 1-interacting protein
MLNANKRNIDVLQQTDKRTDSPIKRTDSPDNDSAFCDNISSNSSSDSSGEKSKSIISSSVHSVVACPRMGTMQIGGNSEDASAKVKAEKIRLAIEKIKEASIKKIFIKVFGEDGSAKSLLVDERMTVAQVCRMLADKNHQVRNVFIIDLPFLFWILEDLGLAC